MVAIPELFSLFGSRKSKLLIRFANAECSGSAPRELRSLISEHVQAEALLQAEGNRQTPLGASLRRAAKQGRPAPDEVVLAVMRRWFWARKVDDGFCLAGFPQNRRQALAFDEWLETRGETLDACVVCAPGDGGGDPVAAHYREQGLVVLSPEAFQPAAVP